MLVPDEATWDELAGGLYFTIARNPLFGDPIPDLHTRVVATKPAPGFGLPSFRVTYDYDDDHVYLLYMEER
jgi:hypothetical protein